MAWELSRANGLWPRASLRGNSGWTAEGHAELGEAGYRLCRGMRVGMERPNPSNHVRVAGSGV